VTEALVEEATASRVASTTTGRQVIIELARYRLQSTCTKKGLRDANAAVRRDPLPFGLGLEPARTSSLYESFSGLNRQQSYQEHKGICTYLILCIQGHHARFVCSDDRLTSFDNIGTYIALQLIREQKQQKAALE
jgi:hypothetical protein